MLGSVAIQCARSRAGQEQVKLALARNTRQACGLELEEGWGASCADTQGVRLGFLTAGRRAESPGEWVGRSEE